LADFEENNMSLSEQLVSYILSAMLSWVPLGNQYERAPDGKWLHNDKGYYVQEDQDEALARYKKTAEAIVAVSLDERNPPLWRDQRGRNDTLEARVRTALGLTAIPSLEGGFHKWVENGDCNTPEFKKNHPHECDGGSAWTNWQIHLYRYIIKDGELFQSQYLEQSMNKDDREWFAAHKDEVITGQQLIADPKLAAQVAYYIIRWSTRSFHSLCGYTGENDGHICRPQHHLADQRLNRGSEYMRAHPFIYVEQTDAPADLLGTAIQKLFVTSSESGRPTTLAQFRFN
jgi:hypothetical protein